MPKTSDFWEDEWVLNKNRRDWLFVVIFFSIKSKIKAASLEWEPTRLKLPAWSLVFYLILSNKSDLVLLVNKFVGSLNLAELEVYWVAFVFLIPFELLKFISIKILFS